MILTDTLSGSGITSTPQSKLNSPEGEEGTGGLFLNAWSDGPSDKDPHEDVPVLLPDAEMLAEAEIGEVQTETIAVPTDLTPIHGAGTHDQKPVAPAAQTAPNAVGKAFDAPKEDRADGVQKVEQPLVKPVAGRLEGQPPDQLATGLPAPQAAAGQPVSNPSFPDRSSGVSARIAQVEQEPVVVGHTEMPRERGRSNARATEKKPAIGVSVPPPLTSLKETPGLPARSTIEIDPAGSDRPRMSTEASEGNLLSPRPAASRDPQDLPDMTLPLPRVSRTKPATPVTGLASSLVQLPTAQMGPVQTPDLSTGQAPIRRDDNGQPEPRQMSGPSADTTSLTQGVGVPSATKGPPVAPTFQPAAPFQNLGELVARLTDATYQDPEADPLADKVTVTTANATTSMPQVVASVTSRPSAIPVAQQLAVALSTAQGTSTQIALNPEELGVVRIALTSGEAGLTVSIFAERQETTDLLRRNIDSLLKEFSDMGYDNPSFSFGEQPQDQDQTPASKAPRGAPVIEADPAPQTVTLLHRLSPTGGLDLKL